MFSERENTGEKSVLIRYEIMIDEATESWEVVKQVPTKKKQNFTIFLTNTENKTFSVDFFKPIIYRETNPGSVKKQRKRTKRSRKANF